MSKTFLAAIRAQEVAKALGDRRPKAVSNDNAGRPSTPLSDAQRLKILTLNKAKVKGTVIAKNMGLNPSTVHNTIRRYDIKKGKVVKLYQGIYG